MRKNVLLKKALAIALSVCMVTSSGTVAFAEGADDVSFFEDDVIVEQVGESADEALFEDAADEAGYSDETSFEFVEEDTAWEDDGLAGVDFGLPEDVTYEIVNEPSSLLETDIVEIVTEDPVPDESISESAAYEVINIASVTINGNTTEYSDFHEALNAALNTTGVTSATIKLLDNITFDQADQWTPVIFNEAHTLVFDGNDKTITNLPGMMFDKTGSGGHHLIMSNVTFESPRAIVDGGYAAVIMGYADCVNELTFTKVSINNATVTSNNYAGAFYGYGAGWNKQSDGPVFARYTFKDCSVTNSIITGGGSTGALIGHATGNAWTRVEISNATVTGNTITGEKVEKEGILIGTLGVAQQDQDQNGGVWVKATEYNNILTHAGGHEIGRNGSGGDGFFTAGGSYTVNPLLTSDPTTGSITAAKGYDSVELADGTWTIAAKDEALLGDSEEPTSFKDAADNATSDQIITLLKDVTDPYPLANGRTIKVKKNGFNVIITNGGDTSYQILEETDENGITTYTAGEAAASVTIGTDVKYYATLAEAVAEADGGTVTVLKRIELDDSIDINGTVTIDLNGNTITEKQGSARNNAFTKNEDHDYLIAAKYGANLTIIDSKGNGAITTEELVVAVKMTTKGETYSETTGAVNITIGDDTDTTKNNFTIQGLYYGISGNGSRHNANLTVNGGTVIGCEPTDSTGIYFPQEGALTINGGTIEGYCTAVELRSGTLSVTGGEFICSCDTYSCSPNGNGTTTSGAAIAIAQHTTNKAIDASITGGTFTIPSSGNAVKLSISNPQDNAFNNVAVSGKDALIGTSVIVPEGYVWVTNGETSVLTKALFSVDTTPDASYYAVFQDAVDEALVTSGEPSKTVKVLKAGEYEGELKEGEAVKVIKDTDVTEDVTVSITAPEGYAVTPNTSAIITDTATTFKVISAVASITKGGKTEYFSTLQKAVDTATSGDEITLLARNSLDTTVNISKSITINLNGYSIAATNTRALHIKTGTVTITGKGTVSANLSGTSDFDADSSVIRVGDTLDSPSAQAGLIINSEVKISSNHCYGITIFGNNTETDNAGQTLKVDGCSIIVSGDNGCISGNGTNTLTNTKIEIKDATLTSNNSTAIYHPQEGTLTISGEKTAITGKDSAIGFKSGTLSISGGTFTATGPSTIPTTGYSNGINASGSALQLESNSDYKGNMVIKISGGTFKSTNATYLYEYVGKGTQTAVSSVEITGGEFKASSDWNKSGDSTGIVISEQLATKIGDGSDSVFKISDGYFSDSPAPKYIEDGKAVVTNTAANANEYPYTIGEKVAEVKDITYGTFKAAAEAAANETGNDKIITLFKNDSYEMSVGESLQVKLGSNNVSLTTTVPEGKSDIWVIETVPETLSTETPSTITCKLKESKSEVIEGDPDSEIVIDDDTTSDIKLTSVDYSIKNGVETEYKDAIEEKLETVPAEKKNTAKVVSTITFEGNVVTNDEELNRIDDLDADAVVFTVSPYIEVKIVDEATQDKFDDIPVVQKTKLPNDSITQTYFTFRLYLTNGQFEVGQKIKLIHYGEPNEEYYETVKEDTTTGKLYVEVTTNHFSYFALSAASWNEVKFTFGENVSSATVTYSDKTKTLANDKAELESGIRVAYTGKVKVIATGSSGYNANISYKPTAGQGEETTISSGGEIPIVEDTTVNITATKKPSTGGGGTITNNYVLTLYATDGASAQPTSTISNNTATVTAYAPATGYTWDGWYVDGTKVASTTVSGTYQAQIPMTANKTAVATYVLNSSISDKAKAFIAEEAAVTTDATEANRNAIDKALKDYAELGADDKKDASVIAAKADLDSKNTAVAAKEKEAADAAAKKINDLPTTVTAADKADVEAARKAYDALTPAEKKLVPESTLKKLTDAEAALSDDKAKADEVDKLIKALPANPTLSDKDQVDAAKKAYDDLTKAQQALVPADDVTKLNNAVKAIEEAEKEKKEADAKAAKAVEDLIKGLPDPANVTSKDKAAIEAVKKQYDALTKDQQALISDANKEKLQKDIDALQSEDQKVVERFTAAVNAVPGSEPGTEKALLDFATDIYNEMTDAQKAIVTRATMNLYNDELEHFKRNYTFRDGDAYYKVLSNGDVTYLKPASRSITSASVPEEAKDGQYRYRVIKVSNNAFRNCKNLKWVVVAKTVYVFGQYVFARTPKLATVKVMGTNFKSPKATDAFLKAGKSSGLTVKAPKSKVSSYSKLFKGEGKLNGEVIAA